MQIKTGLVALSAVATLVLVSGNSVEAKSEGTDKKDEKKTEKVVEKVSKPVIETVKAGDTLTAIAEKYQTSYIRLFNANDVISHPDLINVDQQIRIPSAEETLPDRLSQVSVEVQSAVIAGAAATNIQSSPIGSQARGSSAGNSYVAGTCTYHAKNMRPDLPNRLGNGGQWVANARAQGIATGMQPRVGAIAEQPGHVSYVEAVNGDMVSVSEMGYAGVTGVHYRTAHVSTFTGFIY